MYQLGIFLSPVEIEKTILLFGNWSFTSRSRNNASWSPPVVVKKQLIVQVAEGRVRPVEKFKSNFLKIYKEKLWPWKQQLSPDDFFSSLWV